MRSRWSPSRLRSSLKAATIKEARLALGGVAHKPWRDPAAEAALAGQTPDAATFTRAADILLRDAKGFEHNAFKIDLARRAIVRALTQAAAGTPQVAVQQEDPVTARGASRIAVNNTVIKRACP